MTSVLKLDMEMYSFVHLRFTNAEHKLQTRNESQQRSAHFTYNFLYAPVATNGCELVSLAIVNK